MKALLLCGCFVAASLPAPAQSPAAVAHSRAQDLGFSYKVPADWQVTETPSTLSSVKAQADQNASTEDEKKGVACVELLLSAHHGNPGSVIVELALPFACFGQPMSERDLPGFAAGASEGMKQSFDLSDPVNATYSLGAHHLWMERSKGNPKGHPELPYTMEITCGLLKKAAVCWMTMAADAASLHTFETGHVTLDGERPVSLVPATAFEQKPQ